MNTEQIAALTPTAFSDLLENILDLLISLTHADGAGILLSDKENQKLTVAAAKGFSSSIVKGEKVPIRGSSHGQVFLTSGVANTRPLYKGVEEEKGVSYGALLIVPLVSGESTIGTLTLGTKPEFEGLFPEQDELTALKLAPFLGQLVDWQRILLNEAEDTSEFSQKLSERVALINIFSTLQEEKPEQAHAILTMAKALN